MQTLPREVLSLIAITPALFATLRLVCAHTSQILFTAPIDFYVEVGGHGWHVTIETWMEEFLKDRWMDCVVYARGDGMHQLYTANWDTINSFLRSVGSLQVAVKS